MKNAAIPTIILTISAVILATYCLFLPGCEQAQGYFDNKQAESEAAQSEEAQSEGAESEEGHKIVVTSPFRTDVISTQPYVCQIHSCRHIEVRALEGGYLEEVNILEGQPVQEGDLMFKILPVLYKARMDTEAAEVQQAQIEFNNTKALVEQNVVSDQVLARVTAKLASAQAKLELAQAELSFTDVKAPFTGIVDRQLHQQGSLIEEGDILSTLSDNETMWVYFNVPEAQYLDYMKRQVSPDPDHPQHLTIQDAHIELRLANGDIFNQTAGDTVTVESNFNNETGNIPFRADFPNPDRLLRHGQTGTVLIHRKLQNVVVIPQRATYEILAKQYVYVVDEDNVVHQRDITVQSEQEDIFVIQDGLDEGDKIILEGIRQVRDGDKLENYEYVEPTEVLDNLKYHAE